MARSSKVFRIAGLSGLLALAMTGTVPAADWLEASVTVDVAEPVLPEADAPTMAAPPAADPDEESMRRIRASCGDCCPDWSRYAIFDVLFLQRNNSTGDQPLVFDALGDPVMAMGDLQPGIGTGTRVFYGALVTDTWGWEIGYTGLYGMFGEALATGDGDLSLPPDLDAVVSNFGDADSVRGTSWSTLNMAEINVFRYRCCPECRPTRCRLTDCRPSCHCVDWIAGFVWAGLDERASLAATCCDPPETSSYTTRATTNYFGPQLGMRGRREWRRWAVEGWWKTALCGTSASQSQDPIVDTVTGITERDARSATAAAVGFIGSLNGTLVYRLTDTWGLRAGYNLYWLTNAAFAPSQWDFGTDAGAGSAINDNGTLFLHGANLGAEARW